MPITRLTANDGVMVEFEYTEGSPPKQGGVKDVYFTTDKKYAVAFFRKKLDSVAEDRLDRIVNKYRKQIFENIGGDYFKNIFCWPERIVRMGDKTGIVIPFYDKKFFFGPSNDPDSDLEGVEKEGKWFTSAKNYNKFVPGNQKGDLLGFLDLCLELSRGVKRLHQSGLAHSDLSYKNCLVDPTTGSACIIDIDGLVVPDLFPPDVMGTRDFIAPEVVATMHLPQGQRNLPCQETDHHALSVLIYEYFFHRHPLEGDKVLDMDPEKQEMLEMGEKALFIEDPFDTSNHRKVKADEKDFLPWIDTEKLPYTLAGRHLTELFNKAFIKGLHNPSERPTGDDWEVALVKTKDLLVPCSNAKCPMKWFVSRNSTKEICPYCNTPIKQNLPVLSFYSKPYGEDYRLDQDKLIVYNNQLLFPWHVNKKIFPNERLQDQQKKPVGYFSFYKKKWYLVNQTLTSLFDITVRENPIQIPVNGKVELIQGLVLLLSNEDGGRLAHVTLSK